MSEFNIFGTADRLLSALQRSFLLLRRTPAHAPKLPWTFWQNNAPRGYNLAVEAETAMRYCPNLKSAVQSAEKAICWHESCAQDYSMEGIASVNRGHSDESRTAGSHYPDC